MNLDRLETKNSRQPDDESLYASWGCFIGAGLGLTLTILIGHWFSNTVAGAVVGFFVGALFDRNRK